MKRHFYNWLSGSWRNVIVFDDVRNFFATLNTLDQTQTSLHDVFQRNYLHLVMNTVNGK